MNAALFGRQSNIVWLWSGCGLITIANYFLPYGFGWIGAIAALGFALPIIALILYIIASLFGM